MDDRITKQDLYGMLKRLTGDMRSLGLLASDRTLHLAAGSRTNGNSYQVWAMRLKVDEPRTQDEQPFGTFSFGFTARECYDRMHAMCVALEEVYFNTQKGE